ncbi:MAG: nucleotidyl transferase AbiEii/AbiGii toxin family protein [Deltaproteobacteria bacterium]|nr:nucleotidyl transferase AbiEii/AbiGii toxin family protein [Deltaproteobacteria bacterium]
MRTLRGEVDGVERVVEVNVTGLAGFLLAKTAAARARAKPKDWYDIAFVLLHNDEGGVDEAARAVRICFGTDLAGLRTALEELSANFRSPTDQGTSAYAAQMMIDHPDSDEATLRADAVLAVTAFHRLLVDE